MILQLRPVTEKGVHVGIQYYLTSEEKSGDCPRQHICLVDLVLQCNYLPVSVVDISQGMLIKSYNSVDFSIELNIIFLPWIS